MRYNLVLVVVGVKNHIASHCFQLSPVLFWPGMLIHFYSVRQGGGFSVGQLDASAMHCHLGYPVESLLWDLDK